MLVKISYGSPYAWLFIYVLIKFQLHVVLIMKKLIKLAYNCEAFMFKIKITWPVIHFLSMVKIHCKKDIKDYPVY